jgi:hypothetical protein
MGLRRINFLLSDFEDLEIYEDPIGDNPEMFIMDQENLFSLNLTDGLILEVYEDLNSPPLYFIVPKSQDLGTDYEIMPLLAPAPIVNSTVPAADLNLFVGSGAYDFVAYRSATNISYCIYPVQIDKSGRVQGKDCTTITINSTGTNRVITYGVDDIDRTFSGSSYQYSDQPGRYMTHWQPAAAKTPLDLISTYILITFCVLSLLGNLVRRK